MASPAHVPRRRRAKREQPTHFHFPSVHVRQADGFGYDYQEDVYVRDSETAELVTTFGFVSGEVQCSPFVTRTVLRGDDLAAFAELLPRMMDEGDEESQAYMQARAKAECERHLRIVAGVETRCASCGCSESRSCSGGCVWATRALCSRCV